MGSMGVPRVVFSGTGPVIATELRGYLHFVAYQHNLYLPSLRPESSVAAATAHTLQFLVKVQQKNGSSCRPTLTLYVIASDEREITTIVGIGPKNCVLQLAAHAAPHSTFVPSTCRTAASRSYPRNTNSTLEISCRLHERRTQLYYFYYSEARTHHRTHAEARSGLAATLVENRRYTKVPGAVDCP